MPLGSYRKTCIAVLLTIVYGQINVNCKISVSERFYFFIFIKVKKRMRLAKDILSLWCWWVTERTRKNWFEKLRYGGLALQDYQRSGRPSVVDDDKIKAIIKSRKREISKQLNLTHTTIDNHIRSWMLGFRKNCRKCPKRSFLLRTTEIGRNYLRENARIGKSQKNFFLLWQCEVSHIFSNTYKIIGPWLRSDVKSSIQPRHGAIGLSLFFEVSKLVKW